MTDLIEAARTALDALDGSADFADMMACVDTATEIRDAANALRAAIEAAEKAEPVAWLEGPYGEFRANPGYRIAAPQSVTWSIPLYAGTPKEPQ